MVTGERVKEAAVAANLVNIRHHQCSICDEWVYYHVYNENLYFDPACGCGYGLGNIEPRPWDDAADWINMQTNSATRTEIAAQFGLTLED